MVPDVMRIVLALGAVLAAGCGLDDKDGRGPAPLDASAFLPDASGFCDQCADGEICVQVFDGTCGTLSISCQPRNAACPVDACTPDCMRWHCNGGMDPPFFRCDVGTCGTEVPGAFACYGP